MKTPMQEHIEWLDIQWGNAKDCGEKTIDFEIAMKHAESMLKKEREIICNAFSDARHGAVESRWTAEEYFEEIFNNKDNG